MIRVLLCGASGKMGHAVASVIAGQAEMQVVAGVDQNTSAYADFPIYASFAEVSEKADVIIDFSHPMLLSSLLDYAISTQTPVVAATTGYSEEQLVMLRAASEKVAIFSSFNLSLGINLLVELSRRAAAVLGDQFDIEIVEKHHNQKIDAPSGTAIMLADAINAAGEYHYEYDRHSKRQRRDPREIGIHSIRGGTIVGEHEVIFAGRDETITLSHSATSKEVFAVGAVNAARFLSQKSTGLYNMGDVLDAQKSSI